MARPNPIRRIMEMPLPSKTEQRSLSFRPKKNDIIYAYNIINRHVFDNRLRRPKIIAGQVRSYWGFCQWEEGRQDSGSHCWIKISDKWYCPQWFLNTLAHEMVHQYQWDIYRFETDTNFSDQSGAHGPSFFEWRDRFDYYGLYLKTHHRMKKWFKYQDFRKC